MIAPGSRLLFWTAIAVTPAVTLGFMLPATAPVCAAVAGLVLMAAFADLTFSLGTLDNLTIEIPDVVRLLKDRDGEIDLRILNPNQKQRHVRIALELPREIDSGEDGLAVVLARAMPASRVAYPCTPNKRGKYIVEKSYLESLSTLGFWLIRVTKSVRSEVRVYPNLDSERKNVAALFLNRGNLGIHAYRQVGKGRDFEKLREYVPGDSYDDIHWKATAKRGHPVTKVFQIERTQEVYAIIDASRLMARLSKASSGATTPALERFVTSALVLSIAAKQQGDLFGLISFTDKIENFLRARSGSQHYGVCRDALYTLQPKIVTPDYEELVSFVRTRLRRRALLVFLTALDDSLLADSFVKSVEMISRQHLVLVNMLKPKDAQPIFSNTDVSSPDDICREIGGHLVWSRLREVEKTLSRRGVRFSLLDNERLSAQLVTQYMNVKMRQLL